MTFGMEEVLLEDLKLRKVPLVFVDVGPARARVSNIRIDYLHGIRQAVQHLAALRHHRIAFISGPLHLKSAEARKQAFLSSMEEIGLEVDPASDRGRHSHDRRRHRGVWQTPRPATTRPTAVLCSNDMTAMGVMRKAYEEGIRIPSDLSVIGFDDIRLAQFVLPALTTVQMSQADLARLAFNALLAELQRETPSPTGTEYILKTHLVLRESTRLVSEQPKTSAKKTQIPILQLDQRITPPTELRCRSAPALRTFVRPPLVEILSAGLGSNSLRRFEAVESLQIVAGQDAGIQHLARRPILPVNLDRVRAWSDPDSE